MKKIFTKQKITLIISGLFLCVVLLEIGLRIGGFVFLSLQEYRNRISIKQKGAYRILCLGESTTAFWGEYSYPSQLEKVLNERNIGIKFSVINKGIPGTKSGAIVSKLEDNLNKYSPDMVTVMMGINEREAIPYEDMPVKKITPFLKSFRIFKLVGILQLHIVNKAREIGIYKPIGKKENLPTRINDLMQASNFKEKEKMLKKAIEINPEDDRTYFELGLWYDLQGMYAEAEEMLKKTIEINPENDEAYFRLGLWYRAELMYAEAEEMFKKIIEINPEREDVYVCLGWSYQEQGMYAEAEEMFKKAIEINPRNDGPYFELGMRYWSKGMYDKAEEMLKKAIEINPEDDKLFGTLAQMYEEQGKTKTAQEYFRKAKRLRSEHYNPITRHNYQRLKEIVTQKGIKLVCMQYPVRSVELLKNMFRNKEGIIFVDNEKVFKEALEQASYDEYFIDIFGGDFGHCTPKGNRLIANNLAKIILDYFEGS